MRLRAFATALLSNSKNERKASLSRNKLITHLCSAYPSGRVYTQHVRRLLECLAQSLQFSSSHEFSHFVHSNSVDFSLSPASPIAQLQIILTCYPVKWHAMQCQCLIQCESVGPQMACREQFKILKSAAKISLDA